MKPGIREENYYYIWNFEKKSKFSIENLCNKHNMHIQTVSSFDMNNHGTVRGTIKLKTAVGI